MRILDLFSGIGGFSLGLHRASETFQTVAFCEQDPFCTQILNKHWPDVPVYPDIRKLNGKEIGTIDIVCGGFPCQPFSQAGKRRGKEDDRDLWPEMFRIIRECVPAYVIGENVVGFTNMELDRTVSDLESEGYEVRTFVLGAVAVQAPHQRQRCWIIAHAGCFQSGSQEKPKRASSDFARCSGRTYTRSKEDKRNVSDSKRNGLTPTEVEGSIAETVREKPQGKNNALDTTGTSGLPGTEQDVADSDRARFEQGNEEMAQGSPEQPDRRRVQPGENVSDRNGSGLQGGVQDRESYPEGRQESGNGSVAERGTGRQGNRNGHGSTQRGMGDLADGLSAELLNIGLIWETEPDIPRVTTGEKNRVKKLKALGNSVVPQIPEIIGRLIMEVEREIQSEGIHKDQE